MGKKKKKKGIPHDPAAILKKAEKFFQKGNYLLAGKEFEKLGALTGQKDLLDKIEICDKEVKKQNAGGLLKRARKIEKAGNPGAAIKCFEDAYEVLGEDWIREKIEQLRNKTSVLDARRAAKDAEAAGDYLKAAGLYGRAFGDHETENMVLRKAVCLVKAESYAEAVSTFQNIAVKKPEHLYDFGFSLAKTGRYCECLKTWEGISSQDESFLEQKSLVCGLLVSDLYAAFEKCEDPERIYKEGKYLMAAGYESSGLPLVIEQSMFAWIEVLWGNEDYHIIWVLLRRASPAMEPALLQLYAKVCFKGVEKSGNHGEDLSMFWLSAVYSEEFESRFSDVGECDRVRRELIRLAEDLLKCSSKMDEGTAEKILAQWSLEKEATEEIRDLVRKRKKSVLPVMTPRLAAQMGKSTEFLELIRKNRRFFKNREDYLRIGCCYSPARESFYHLVGGEYEKAVQTLTVGEGGDEFTDYAEGRVFFTQGLLCIKRGAGPPDEYPGSMAAFFETVPEYEKKFVKEALDAEDANVLQRFEEALTNIYDRRPLDGLAEALSLVMSRRAVKMISQKLINEKVFSMRLNKALEINPGNEHARGLLRDAESNLEMMAVEKALDRHKMNAACKIVIESRSDVVREAFFDYFERSIENIEEEVSSESEKIFYLKDIYKWCVRVDDDHDILYDIEEILEELEGANIE